MNHFTTRATYLRTTTLLAALAMGGLFSVAQAQPGYQGPPSGWPSNGNGRYGNDRYGKGNSPWNEREVQSGEVVRRYSNTEYDLRAGDGHIFRVKSDDAITLNRGDDVRVSGDWRGSIFLARSITLIDRDGGFGNWGDNGNWDNGNFRARAEFIGTVARRFSNQTFEFQTPTGRTYLVRGDNFIPNLRYGDRVRIVGLIDGNRIRATQISNLSANGGVVGPRPTPGPGYGNGGYGNGGYGNGGYGNGGYGNGGYGNGGRDWSYPNPPRRDGNGGPGRGPGDAGVGLTVDFPGRIETMDRNGTELSVRGDNGRIYRVRTTRNELEGYRVGDRIRVKGTVRDDFITAQDLNRIR